MSGRFDQGSPILELRRLKCLRRMILLTDVRRGFLNAVRFAAVAPREWVCVRGLVLPELVPDVLVGYRN